MKRPSRSDGLTPRGLHSPFPARCARGPSLHFSGSIEYVVNHQSDVVKVHHEKASGALVFDPLLNVGWTATQPDAVSCDMSSS